MALSSEDKWIPSVCYMCYGCCGILVRQKDGIIVEIKGDPDNPHNVGKLCAKGKSGLMGHYDPYRLKTPLRRTNPEKGIGIDPKWEEISWDEALEIIAGKLKKIKEDDPGKLVMGGLDFHQSLIMKCFASAFGTKSYWMGAATYFCGNGLHSVLYLTNAAFYAEPDYKYCNYCLLIGSRVGFMLNTNATTMTTKAADARARGMKVVMVDPICHLPGGSTDEWIPIRPGTDAAFALGMVNILLNDLGLYDGEFIKAYTNGPYLIGSDGHYLREAGTGKPLVWDGADGRAKPYDGAAPENLVIEGTFQVNGSPCAPAFQLLKEHVKKYQAEKVSEITTVPAETLRRIAREFGEAARIGSKVVFEGVELPYRPVAVNWNKGAMGHRHSMLTGLAIQLLNIVVGAMDVPGGQLGCNPVGPFWVPREGSDGLIVPADAVNVNETCYPAREVTPPISMELRELFPVAPYSGTLFDFGVLHAQELKFPFGRPELMINVHSNPMIATSNPGGVAEVLKRIPFLVHFTLHLDETAEFADLVLPDAHYLERLVAFPNSIIEWLAPGPGSWYWMMEQPVAKPDFEARHWSEVLFEIADRIGIRRDCYMILNASLGLKEPFRLDPDKKYTWEEIVDIRAKARFGSDHGLEWFRDHGFYISAKKKVHEAYPRTYMKGRIPIYLEHFIKAGQEVKKVTQEMGFNWDTSDYQPLPDWKPCPAFHERETGFDLYPVNYKLPFHTFSTTVGNPWLNDLSEHHRYAYKILIHTGAAERRGIKDGDLIEIESKAGKIQGIARLTECIHPEVVGIAGTFGHWAKGMPTTHGKGAHFNTLIPYSLDRIDTVSAALDSCVKVKVCKAPYYSG